MKRQRLLLPITLAALLVSVAALIPRPSGEASAQSATNKSSALLGQVAGEVWQRKLKSPAARLEQGLPINELPRWSAANAEADAAFARDVLKKLEAVNEQELSHEEWLTLAVVRWDARNDSEEARHFWLRSPVTPYASYLRTVHQIFQTFRFERAGDTDRYLDLLAEYPRLIEEIHGYLRRQTARGIVLPKDEVENVTAFLKGFVRDPDNSLFNVSDQRLAAIEAQAAGRLKQQLAAEIVARTNPALERLVAYVAGAYRASAPEQVGLWQYPGGTDYYRHLVRFHTTMEITPEEAHETGLREVERIEREMAEVRDKLGFRGAKAEFHRFLKTDPRFFPKTPDEIRAKLLGFAGSINPKLDRLFLTRPKAPFDAERLSPALEASMTFGYYQRPRPGAPTGTYYFNGSKLEERSLLHAEGMIYHELVPGHHFHIASQSENDRLHPVRKNFYPTAFTEGWAVYASFLGRELGQYQDLYDLYGHLTMEMMASVRLVVDTGMNHLKWPRARAIEFMRSRTLFSETEIGTETLRYSTDIPAQALAYKMGEIRILELREQARQSLGDKFDIRRFHEAVLGSGALPMTVLERHVNWFIDQERKQ
ncbi:MAG: DUF885 domain-containing protein [Blastocatellia bacterium]